MMLFGKKDTNEQLVRTNEDIILHKKTKKFSETAKTKAIVKELNLQKKIEQPYPLDQ